MSNLSGVIILNHWKREQEGRALKKLVHRDCDPLGIEVGLSFDPGTLNPLKNLCQALQMPLRQASGFRLVLHDDMMAPRLSFSKLDYILDFMPRAVLVSAYCPSNNGYDRAFEGGHHILKTATNIWGQALVFPEVLIPKFIKFVSEKVKPGYYSDDRTVSTYLQARNMKCHCIIPSLFQHLGSYRSTLGFPGKVGGRYRYSDHYDPNFNPRKINWPLHIKTAARNETRVDVKEVLI